MALEFGFTRDSDHPGADTRADPMGGQVARFFYDFRDVHDITGQPVLDEEGKQKINRMLLVEISSVADPNCKPVVKATEAHKVMYRRYWEAFERQEDITKVAGTPLNRLGDLDLIQQYQMQGMGIMSIEALADVGEHLLLSKPFLRHWKTKARGYVIQNKPRPDQGVIDELAELRAQVAMLSKGQPAIVEAVSPQEKAKREAARNEAAASGKPDVMRRKPGPKPKNQIPAVAATEGEAA